MIVCIHKSELSKVSIFHWEKIKRFFSSVDQFIVFKHPSELPDCTGQAVMKVGNSCFLGSEVFDGLQDWLAKALFGVLITDDYTTPPPTQVRNGLKGKKNICATTIPDFMNVMDREKAGWKWVHDSFYVNWNQATYRWPDPPARKTPRVLKENEQTLVYYGCFREGRVEAIAKYFETDLYETAISTSPKGREKFPFEKPWYFKRFDLDVDLGDYPMTVYMEDQRSHEIDTSPANRFYECLSLGCAMAIDRESAPTLIRAGYAVYNDWIVDCATDVQKLLQRWREVRYAQQKAWLNAKPFVQLRDQLEGLRARIAEREAQCRSGS